MKFYVFLSLFSIFIHIATPEKSQVEDAVTFLLYNSTSLTKVTLLSNDFIFEPLELKVNTEKGLEFDPILGGLFWSENGALMFGHLNEYKRSPIWIPDRLGRLFHYDWERKWLYWYTEYQQDEPILKVIDVTTKDIHIAQTKIRDSLEAIDSLNSMLIYKFEENLGLFNMHDLSHRGNIWIGREYTLMDVIPENKKLVIQRTSGEDKKQYSIKILDYEGNELFEYKMEKKFDDIILQGSSMIMKKGPEIFLFDTIDNELKFSSTREDFTTMKLKRLKVSDYAYNTTRDISDGLVTCRSQDTEDLCIIDDQLRRNGDGECPHQAYIVSDGNSFLYYNPASKTIPRPLPFTESMYRSIRAFTTYKRERVFWIQDVSNYILMNFMYTDEKPVLIHSSGEYPSDVKVDEQNQYVFWSDEKKGTIEVSNFNGIMKAVLFSNLTFPTTITVLKGSVIWVEGKEQNKLKLGLVNQKVQKTLFESEDPIFAYTIDNLHNLLYVACQSSHLTIYTVNLTDINQTMKVFESEFQEVFKNMFYSRHMLYFWSSGSFWKLDTSSGTMTKVREGKVPESQLSPIKCVDPKPIDPHCQTCASFCFPEIDDLTFESKDGKCMELKRVIHNSTCYLEGFILAASKNIVYYLSDECLNEIASVKEDFQSRQPVAHDTSSNTTFILDDRKVRSVHRDGAVLGEPVGYLTNSFSETHLTFIDGASSLFMNTSSVDYHAWNMIAERANKENLQAFADIICIIPYPKKNLVFILSKAVVSVKHYKFLIPSYDNVDEFTIHAYSLQENSKVVFKTQDKIDDIKLSYEENRIYYLEGRDLKSFRVDGKKWRKTEIDLPEIQTFTFLNRKMYFVSKSDGKLYRLDHLNPNSNIEPLSEKPKALKYLLGIPNPSVDANLGCTQFKAEEGDCFDIYG